MPIWVGGDRGWNRDIPKMMPPTLCRTASTVAPSDISEAGTYEGDGYKAVHREIQSEITLNIKPFSVNAQASPRLWSIVQQVKQIGESAFWGNNCLVDCNTRQGWRLNVISQPPAHGDEVFGFIVYKVDSQHKVLHIQYIAVSENHRRRGIGSKLIKSLQKYATNTLTRNTVEKMACACVPEAVEFYQKHNFRKGQRILPEEGDAPRILADGRMEVQIPLKYQMEWKVPAKKGTTRR